MKERPILMSSPMVRAILAGSKTQTRRAVKPQPSDVGGEWRYDKRKPLGQMTYWWPDGQPANDKFVRECCPYGAPGDRLWVRETTIITPKKWNDGAFCTHKDADGEPRIVQYLATHPDREAADDYKLKATPSRFMPRWACRLVLEITSVRVERLLAISVNDCFEEGIEAMRCPQCHLACYGLPGWGHDDVQKTPNEAYWQLWDQINEVRGYGRAKNPWCWVLTFKRIEEARKAA